MSAPGSRLPLIQSVISLADGDGGTGKEDAAARLPAPLPGVRDHPALVLMPPAPVYRRNVCVQVQPRHKDEKEKEKETATVATQTGEGRGVMGTALAGRGILSDLISPRDFQGSKPL